MLRDEDTVGEVTVPGTAMVNESPFSVFTPGVTRVLYLSVVKKAFNEAASTVSVTVEEFVIPPLAKDCTFRVALRAALTVPPTLLRLFAVSVKSRPAAMVEATLEVMLVVVVSVTVGSTSAKVCPPGDALVLT